MGEGSDPICGTRPVDVKGKMHKAANLAGENRNEAAKSRRSRAKSMINRETAWCLLTEFTQSESLRKHALAVEACMRACSRKFATDPGTSGLSELGFAELGLSPKTCGASSDWFTSSTTRSIPASKTIPTRGTRF